MENLLNEKLDNSVFVDSHCHLIFEKFIKHSENNKEYYKIDSIINRANKSRVKYILAIGTKLDDIQEIQNISIANENVFQTIGIHPLETQQHTTKYSYNDIYAIITNNLINLSKIVGIGEIGLDYYYSKDNMDTQKKLFEFQLDIARAYNIPVCIHSRDAEKDTIDILKHYSDIRGVIHCFTGSEKFAFNVLDLGFYISISGVITFKKSETLCNTVGKLPIDCLLLETDSPFLAPTPYRGKTNEPAFIPYTAKKLAEILQKSEKEITEKTTQNFFKLYNRENR